MNPQITQIDKDYRGLDVNEYESVQIRVIRGSWV